MPQSTKFLNLLPADHVAHKTDLIDETAVKIDDTVMPSEIGQQKTRRSSSSTTTSSTMSPRGSTSEGVPAVQKEPFLKLG